MTVTKPGTVPTCPSGVGRVFALLLTFYGACARGQATCTLQPARRRRSWLPARRWLPTPSLLAPQSSLQEFTPGSSATDRPTPLDPDGSGRLADDHAAWRQQPRLGVVPFPAAVHQTPNDLPLRPLLPRRLVGPSREATARPCRGHGRALVIVTRRSGRVDKPPSSPRRTSLLPVAAGCCQ